mgnify:FL=1
MHDQKCGSVPSERILRSVRVEPRTVDEPMSFQDYDVRVDPIPGVSHTAIVLADAAAISSTKQAKAHGEQPRA